MLRVGELDPDGRTLLGYLPSPCIGDFRYALACVLRRPVRQREITESTHPYANQACGVWFEPEPHDPGVAEILTDLGDIMPDWRPYQIQFTPRF